MARDSGSNLSFKYKQELLKLETAEKKARFLYWGATRAIKEFFADPSPATLRECKIASEAFAEAIMDDKVPFLTAVQILTYDYTIYSHSVNVCLYAVGVAKKMELPKEEAIIVAAAALLHDSGKRTISATILSKQGGLSEAEFDIMKQYPQQGVELLQNVGEENKDILAAVQNHQEKRDGSGYPASRRDDTIPLTAQIICVCDVFDALTTKRPYKDAIGSFDALHLMHKEMGKKLNPKALSALILCFRS